MSNPYYHYPPVEHPKGTAILVLGILGLVVCGLTGPFAWVMGNRAIREMDSTPYQYSNRGMIQAGRICGIISSFMMIFVCGIYLLMFLVMGIGFLEGIN